MAKGSKVLEVALKKAGKAVVSQMRTDLNNMVLQDGFALFPHPLQFKIRLSSIPTKEEMAEQIRLLSQKQYMVINRKLIDEDGIEYKPE